MLRPLVKLLVASAFSLTFAVMYIASEEKDPTKLVGALGFAVLAAVEYWDWYKSDKETKASEQADKKKRYREIYDDVRLTYWVQRAITEMPSV